MRITKLPGGEYYLQKNKDQSHVGTFQWSVRASKSNCGQITLTSTISTPKELIGKKIMFKVEVMEDKENERNE